jgi:tRNA pseudouridine55 synthase
VRALARDLASALGTVGHLTRLRRTRAGDFTLADARDVEDVLALIPLATAASRALPAITLSDSGVLDAKNGRPVALADMSQKTKGPCAWLDGSGALIAVGEIVAGAGKVLRGFRRA